MADATLGTAVLRTSLDASGLKAGLTSARRDTDQAVSAISQQIGGLSREFTVLGNEVKAGLRPLTEYRDALKQQEAELRQLIETLDRASTEYDEATTHLAAVREELARVNAELADSGDKTKSFSDRMKGLGRNLTTLGGALTIGVTAPLTAIGAVGVKSAMQLETFAASLNVLIGDAERANRVFDELYEFSANTPFDWRTLTEGTRVLAAFGTEAEDIVPTLSMLGDIAAGTQSDLARLAEIYGRVLVTGRMSMDEVNQLAARGVPIYTELASVLGVSTDQVRELVSQGMIGFPELERVIRNLTSEGGKFFGMMDAQADTVAGRLARLKDSFEQVTDIVGERLLPVFDRLVDFGQRATDWFVNLDESTQQWIVGLGVGLAASGPILVGVGTLLVQIPKLVASFQTLRTAILPFLGPVGILAGAVAGYLALNEAMNAGRSERAQASADFQDLVRQMGAYRDQLVITGEEERQQLIASLERRREALIKVAQMNEAMIRQMESEVIAFANMPWWQQLFNFGATNVTLDALEKAEADLRAVRRELDAIDTQIGQVRTMEITPNVTVPDPIEVGDDYDAFGIPKDGTTREVEVEVVVSDPAAAAKRWVERLEAELRFGLKGPSEVIDLLSPRVEELRAEAASALAEFGIDSEAYQDTVAKLDVIEGALQRLQNLSQLQVTAAAPGIVGLSDEPVVMTDERRQEAAALLEQVERAARLDELEADRQRIAENRRIAMEIMADTEQAMADAAERDRQARLDGYREEMERIAENRRQAAAIAADTRQAMADRRAELEAFNQRVGDLSLQLGARTSRGDGGLSVLQAGRRSIDDVEQELSAARAAVRAAATDEARHEAQLVVMELERELERLTRQITPRALDIEPRVQLARPAGIEPTAQVAPARSVVVPEVTVQIDGMDPAEWARQQQLAADSFAQTVVDAGFRFGEEAIRAIQDGDIPGLIRAGLSGAGSILGGANLGTIPFLGGGIGIGTLIAGGLGVLGTLVGALFGGGRGREADRAAAEARRVGNVPAINLNFTVNQTNTYNGSPSHPENEQAFRRQANVLFEELYRRHLGPRLDRIEQRLGIAGAGA